MLVPQCNSKKNKFIANKWFMETQLVRLSGLTKVSKIVLKKKEIAQNSKLETHF
jgi:hypothetical protein